MAAARDLCNPIEGPNLDDSFDLHKSLQNAKRRVLNARQLERSSVVEPVPTKRPNLRSSRRSSRNLTSELSGPDFSFIRELQGIGSEADSSSVLQGMLS